MTDFSKALVRCSAIGLAMSENRGCITDKQLQKIKDLQCKDKLTMKQLEELSLLILKREESEDWQPSDTCMRYLIELHGYMLYGRRFKDKDYIKQIQKGTQVEEDSIDLVSRLDKRFYQKNEERINNEFVTGIPDLYLGESILSAEYLIDIKSSWDWETFRCVSLGDLSKGYNYQLQGYFGLTGARKGEVSHVLVNTPESIMNDEKRRLFYKLDVATEENPKYLKAAAELELSMIFDDIPIERRRTRFIVDRDDDLIKKIYKRVEQCRVWLIKYHEEYEKQYPLREVIA
jgi:hypothetical protein